MEHLGSDSTLIEIELGRIAEQTKTKITARPADLADFSILRQVAQELGR